MHELRRKDRAVSDDDAMGILKKAEYGVLSTVCPDGTPYGVPLNFCFVENAIYFHCAVEGRKIDNVERNPSVSFCVVGATEVMPAKFGTKYESVIVSGTVGEVFDKEKQAALEKAKALRHERVEHRHMGLEAGVAQDGRDLDGAARGARGRDGSLLEAPRARSLTQRSRPAENSGPKREVSALSLAALALLSRT